MAFVIIFVLAFVMGSGSPLDFLFPTETPTPTATYTPSNTPTLTSTVTYTPSVTPTATIAVSNENIKVSSPQPFDEVSSPIQIKGEARVFENIVNFRLLDSSGKEVTDGSAYAQSPDVGQWGDFAQNLYFKPQTGNGTLEVFWYSPKDGSDLDKIVIPIRFK